MGLEAATYVSQLDAGNPLAGDRKNQGDDHLRLIKAALKATFPTASRPFRFPTTAPRNVDTNLDTTYQNTVVTMDSAGGVRQVFLPTTLGVGDTGWQVSIVKSANSGNPVFVQPGAASIIVSPAGGLFTVPVIRADVPFTFYNFVWDGAGWLHQFYGPRPGTIEIFAGPTIPFGFAAATGQSLLRQDYPELFNAWGVTFGAVDGTHFTVPDLRDRFPTFSGGSYALGATGGQATHTLIEAELPAHTHSITQNPHTHTVHSGFTGNLITGVDTLGGASPVLNGGAVTIDAANADIVINNTGGNTAHENRPPYFAFVPIFRLC